MSALPFSPFPEQFDAIYRRQVSALTASRLGERLFKDTVRALEKELQCGWIPFSIRPGKRPSRVVAKISRALQRAEEEGENLTFDDALHEVKDLAGGRFLIPYLKDSRSAHQIFCEFGKKKRSAVLDGDVADYNTNPQASGYRGLHQGILVKLDRRTWFPFEVQFLTFLQADWASKEHLVYENPEKFPESLRGRLRELSDALHSISISFGDLRDEIASIG